MAQLTSCLMHHGFIGAKLLKIIYNFIKLYYSFKIREAARDIIKTRYLTVAS